MKDINRRKENEVISSLKPEVIANLLIPASHLHLFESIIMSSFTNISTCMPEMFGQRLCKFLAILGLVALTIYVYMINHPCCQSASTLLFEHTSNPLGNDFEIPTNLSHIAFGIAGSTEIWSSRRCYVEAWWRPNKTRGYIFMDRAPVEHLPWPTSSPPLRISEDNSRYKEYNKHRMPHAVRIIRVIEETFKADSRGDVRWYVMADDDTVLLLDNLVEVLSKYDHRKYFYIGMNSESVVTNWIYSFEMACGGAGYALSYPLAKAVAKNMDLCIKRYPTLFGSDHMMQSCIADLGVPLTKEKGFHQIDFHGDISGFLSAHPQTPFLSLHHLGVVDPLFPSMNREDSVRHLMKAAKVDESRLLQQSICYYNIKNWSFSVSWGYSIQIYEEFIPPSILQRPMATFTEWLNGAHPPFMFNSRPLPKNPCEAPHVFFFDTVEESRANHMVTSYKKRLFPQCSSGSTNHSAEYISKIYVLSPKRRLQTGAGSRRECCDVVQLVGLDSLAIKLRACMKYEMIR